MPRSSPAIGFGAVAGGILVTLLMVAAALGYHGSTPPASTTPGAEQASEPRPPVRVIARRIEELRELRFERMPRPVVVTEDEAREWALAQIDRQYPVAKRRADEETLKLLGLLEPGADLREIEGEVVGEAAAGFYDPRRDRLFLVEREGGEPVFDELTLAHELVHALEDQQFDIEGADDPAGDDATLAHLALVEGTATGLMIEYSKRHIDSRRFADAQLTDPYAGSDPPELPDYVMAVQSFSYQDGTQLAQALYGVTDDYKLLDHALSTAPPASTEQVLHPYAYLQDDRPERVRLPVASLLGDGWTRTQTAALGEFDTRQLLRLAGDQLGAEEAAAGWEGGRLELWQRSASPGEDCPAPCRTRDVLALAWTWDRPADARELAREVPTYLEDGLGGAPLGAGGWTIEEGAAALSRRGTRTALAFAPTRGLARIIAARSVR